MEGVWRSEEDVKDGIWVRGRGKGFMLEVAEDEIGKVRICSGEGGEKFV